MSEERKLADVKISDIKDVDIMRGFIATAGMGLCNKDETLDKKQVVEDKLDDLNSRLAELEDALQGGNARNKVHHQRKAMILSKNMERRKAYVIVWMY